MTQVLLWGRYEFVPAAVVDAALAEIVGGALGERGFEQVARRRWVRSGKEPIRDVLEVQALKGASFCPVWGFSLDYVPHVSGQSVRWHRTVRSARLDLRYDPADYGGWLWQSWLFDAMGGERRLRRDVESITPAVLRKAEPFWGRVRCVADVPALIQWLRSRKSPRFAFDNYPQQRLADAFTLARLGDEARGREVLDGCVAEYGLPPAVASRLAELLAEAGRPIDVGAPDGE